jgi:ribonuclease J
MTRTRTKPKLKIIPLGGLGEIGKNMTVMECGNDIIIIDCGLMFPEEEMLGIDLVIPDISYLADKLDRIRGIVITHGHQDHIGALPYLLSTLNAPVYATRLTDGLIRVALKQQRAKFAANLHVVPTGETIQLGKFQVEMFPVCHSIPDAVGLIIRTPVGIIVHSGDFKLDHTPVDGKPTDLNRLARIGAEGVRLLMADSTYAEVPGYTPSERVVGENLDRVMAEASGRVIVATFSSLVSRVQQVIDAAAKYDRKIAFIGRAMKDTVRMSIELGYLNAPEGMIVNVEDLRRYPADRVAIVTTGSQGEPTSALVRMVNGDLNQLRVAKGDTVVISATPIPGNESLVYRIINLLFKQGARVLYSGVMQVHVHGHASQEELKLMLNLVKPQYFLPVHGEYRHLMHHARLAESVGIPGDNIFVQEDGDIIEVDERSVRVAGKVTAGNVYVDGASVGDVDKVVIRDRKMLSRDGIVMVIIALNRQTGKLVGRPDIVTRGFIDIDESRDMIEESRDVVAHFLDQGRSHPPEWGSINTKVKETLGKFYYQQTRRRPMILPFMVKV